MPGSLVFRRPRGPVDLRDVRNWWAYVPGRVLGATRTARAATIYSRGAPPGHAGRYEDARGVRRLGRQGAPDRGRVGVRRPRRARGRARSPGATSTFPDGRDDGQHLAGRVPVAEPELDGYEGTSPVGSVPAERLRALRHDRQRLGVDVRPRSRPTPPRRAPCCAPPTPGERFPRSVIKGGSHLCAPNYCLRYRPAARQGEAIDTSTSHIGFRCVVRASTNPEGGR